MIKSFIGIDVQSARDCPYAVLDHHSHMIESGWLQQDCLKEDALKLIDRHSEAAVGIDAPRQPLTTPRQWYWRNGKWRPKKETEKGMGRHCEIVLKANNIANPQWTPLESDAPEWMANGFTLFQTFDSHSKTSKTYEVFPSASYTVMHGCPDISANISFDYFLGGPKDMLDAVVSALTVIEYVAGRGISIGGGDNLGKIILPRPFKIKNERVLEWPRR